MHKAQACIELTFERSLRDLQFNIMHSLFSVHQKVFHSRLNINHALTIFVKPFTNHSLIDLKHLSVIIVLTISNCVFFFSKLITSAQYIDVGNVNNVRRLTLSSCLNFSADHFEILVSRPSWNSITFWLLFFFKIDTGYNKKFRKHLAFNFTFSLKYWKHIYFHIDKVNLAIEQRSHYF